MPKSILLPPSFQDVPKGTAPLQEGALVAACKIDFILREWRGVLKAHIMPSEPVHVGAQGNRKVDLVRRSSSIVHVYQSDIARSVVAITNGSIYHVRALRNEQPCWDAQEFPLSHVEIYLGLKRITRDDLPKGIVNREGRMHRFDVSDECQEGTIGLMKSDETHKRWIKVMRTNKRGHEKVVAKTSTVQFFCARDERSFYAFTRNSIYVIERADGRGANPQGSASEPKDDQNFFDVEEKRNTDVFNLAD